MALGVAACAVPYALLFFAMFLLYTAVLLCGQVPFYVPTQRVVSDLNHSYLTYCVH